MGKCDICGTEMRMTDPRYRVIFDGWLYQEEKKICVSCFERIADEIKQAGTPQTDIHSLTDCDFCKEKNCEDCEGGKDEPQTERSE